MDMTDLQSAWNRLDERLQEHERGLDRLFRQRGMDRVRTRLRFLSIGPLLQFIAGVLITLWAGGYWTAHLGETHLVVYGVAIHLYGVGLAIAAALQLARVWRVDYRAPVLQVQAALIELRRVRIGGERVMVLAGFVVWLPMMLVALRAVGLDLWLVRPGNVLVNVGVALGLVLLVAWLMRRFRRAFERDAAGRHLREAEAELAELGSPAGEA
jgi:hypothetical protein